ncbi:protein of unknown function [Maridesulfovibrio ferrireducens]|uniref:DUF4390 domain-containing protein n=1 Tax=Maridesulfovibrio ferrireducens TaxID=246191 RepID=A0A1G9CIQ8_9BACT|nr:DUF4390 domain-containing protein [Maridesulfovibrio ferrireducens]SDK51364.1 protein of unknown function [Maridesulfovibrio ferrireducens]
MTAEKLTTHKISSTYTLPINILVITCALFAMLFFSSPANAASLDLKNLILDNQAGAIMARFGLDLKGDTKTEEALENGGRLKLECEATLFVHKSLWPNSKIASKIYSDKLFYDSLSKNFVLEQSGKTTPLRNKKLTLLLQKGWDSIVMDLGPWSTLKRGERYRLKLDVHLDQTDVPEWLKKTLFFWSWDIVPSATYQLDFTY